MGLGFFVASLILYKELHRKNMMQDFSKELLIFLRIFYSIAGLLFIVSFLIESGVQGIETAFDTKPMFAFGLILLMIGTGYALFNKKSPTWVTADTSGFVVAVSIIGGVSGSKLLYVAENISEFVRAPFDTVFSPGGLTWYGGFVLVTMTLFFFTRKKGLPFLRMSDAAAPALMIGYGIARIGCHLAGDGDYGMPTTLPWGMVYSNGTYPPSVAFRDFPEIVQRYGVNGVVPDTIPVHPAPLYEFIAGLVLFFVLWKFRRSFKQEGQLFMLYLILAGIARLSVEFIRLNPRLLFGLTEAQLFSILMVIGGALGYMILRKRTALL